MLNLGIGRVQRMTSENIFNKENSIYKFIKSCEGNYYSKLQELSQGFYNENNPDYFGQIITPINILGLINTNESEQLINNNLLDSIYNNENLTREYMNYFLSMWQFPIPSTKIQSGRNREIIKPYCLLLKLLTKLYEVNPNEAYLTSFDYAIIFLEEDSPILKLEDITTEYANNIIWNRENNRQRGISQENNSLSYILGLLEESYFLTVNSNDYNNVNDFYVGLIKSEKNYNIALHIANSYETKFYFDKNISDRDRKVINEYGKYINDENKYKRFIKNIKNIINVYDFKEYCENKGYYYDIDLIRRFITSLETKRFLLITGISGTGKTKIAELWIDFLNCNLERSLQIAIGSNWNDNKKLLGFKNILFDYEKSYEPTKLVNLFRKANNDLDNEYIIILDEMNLSYVERYFADFLSALESLKREILLPDGSSIYWTDNIKVIGTVNIDETTYMFSPKVLDRANVIEMNGIQPSKYIEVVANSNGKIYKDINEKKWFEHYKVMIDELYLAMNRNFSYRVIDEITKYIANNMMLFDNNKEDIWKKYLDEQIYQKILPKLHGNRAEIEPILNNIEKIINEDFVLTKSKINDMKTGALKGYISFIGD